MALTFRLTEFSRTFATRGRGRQIREELLARAAGHDVAVVDFADVTNVSYSFADEFAGKLASEEELDLQLDNMSPAVARVIERAMQRRASAVVC